MMGKPEEELVTMTSMGYSTRSIKIAPEKVVFSSPRLKFRSSESKGESSSHNFSQNEERKCGKSEHQEYSENSSTIGVNQSLSDEWHREQDISRKYVIKRNTGKRESTCFAKEDKNKFECQNENETSSKNVFMQLSFDENQLNAAGKCDDTKQMNWSSFEGDVFLNKPRSSNAQTDSSKVEVGKLRREIFRQQILDRSQKATSFTSYVRPQWDSKLQNRLPSIAGVNLNNEHTQTTPQHPVLTSCSAKDCDCSGLHMAKSIMDNSVNRQPQKYKD